MSALATASAKGGSQTRRWSVRIGVTSPSSASASSCTPRWSGAGTRSPGGGDQPQRASVARKRAVDGASSIAVGSTKTLSCGGTWRLTRSSQATARSRRTTSPPPSPPSPRPDGTCSARPGVRRRAAMRSASGSASQRRARRWGCVSNRRVLNGGAACACAVRPCSPEPAPQSSSGVGKPAMYAWIASSSSSLSAAE